MAKREKPATAWEKIANTVYHEGTMTDALLLSALSRRIDRAIGRAVKRERLRCIALIANEREATPYTAVPKATISRVLCSIEEGENP